MVHLPHLKSETFPTSLIYYKIKARIKHQCPGQYMIHWQHYEIVVGKLLPRSRSTTTLPAQRDHVTCVCPHSFLNCRQHILRIHQAYFERNKKKSTVQIWNIIFLYHWSAKACEYNQNGCCLTLQHLVPNFKQRPTILTKGMNPSSLSNHVFWRWEGPQCLAELMNTCHTDGHTMQTEPMSNKNTKRDFFWKCSIQADGLLPDSQLWRCEGEGAAWHYKGREYRKKPAQKSWKWKETMVAEGHILSQAPSFTETARLHKLTNSLLRCKAVWSRFCNTYNQKSHQLPKFLFWPLPWTPDIMNEHYTSSHLVSWLYRKIIAEMLWFRYSLLLKKIHLPKNTVFNDLTVTTGISINASCYVDVLLVFSDLKQLFWS